MREGDEDPRRVKAVVARAQLTPYSPSLIQCPLSEPAQQTHTCLCAHLSFLKFHVFHRLVLLTPIFNPVLIFRSPRLAYLQCPVNVVPYETQLTDGGVLPSFSNRRQGPRWVADSPICISTEGLTTPLRSL